MARFQLKLEQVGAPNAVSPEVRYGQLHRDLEKGLDCERSWTELCEVCLRLGKIGEAAKTLRHIYTPCEAMRLMRLLEHHGVIVHGSVDADREGSVQPRPSNDRQKVAPRLPKPRAELPAPRMRPPASSVQQARPTLPPTHAQRSVPVAQDMPVQEPGQQPCRRRAGSGHSAPRDARSYVDTVQVRQPDGGESFIEEVQDSFRFLFRDHMPVTAMGLTVLFTIAALVGFLLPSGLGPYVTFVIPLLPTLAVAGLFLHCAHRVLVDASNGHEDPPSLEEMLEDAVAGSTRALAIVTGIAVLCFASVVVGVLLEVSGKELIGLALLGVTYAPVVLLGLALGKSWEAILPGSVIRVVAADVGGWVKLIALFGMLLVLPVVGVLVTADGALYLQAAMAGPLIVLPGLVLARLMGRFYYARSKALAPAMGLVVERMALMSYEDVRAERESGKASAVRSGMRRYSSVGRPAPAIRRRPPALTADKRRQVLAKHDVTRGGRVNSLPLHLQGEPARPLEPRPMPPCSDPTRPGPDAGHPHTPLRGGG